MSGPLEKFDHVYDVYERDDGKCAAVRKERTYFVYTNDGELIEMDGHTQTRIYAGLRALFGDLPLIDDPGIVPVNVAVAGKPDITTYLYLSHYDYYHEKGWYSEGREELADTVDVSRDTVLKYIRRTAEKAKKKRIGGERNRLTWR